MTERQTLSTAERDRLWMDPQHWNRDASYQCAADPRLFVPQRKPGGWPINMGHPRAQFVLWSLLLAVAGFVVGLAVLVAHAT
jgi:uncharacterized membrane protein